MPKSAQTLITKVETASKTSDIDSTLTQLMAQ
jgi:hypothetical protein